MATGNKVYMSSKRGVYFALFLLLIIIFSTTWLYYQNNNVLEEKTNSLNEKIKEQEQDLSKLKKDNILQVFSLLKSNYSNFKIKEKYSNIPVLINKIEDLGREYQINFTSFSYGKGKINLKAESRKTLEGKMSDKIVNLVGNFRKKVEYIENKEGKNSNKKIKIIKPKIKDFNLDFIKTFSGKNKIDFNMILKINPKEYLKDENKKTEKNTEINTENNKKEEKNSEINTENNKKEEVKQTIAEKIKAQNEKKKKQAEKNIEK